MMFTNLYDFKGFSRQLHVVLKRRNSKYVSIVDWLLSEDFSSFWADTEQVLRAQKKLTPIISELTDLSLQEVYEILSREFLGSTYNSAIRTLAKQPLDFYRLFGLNFQFSACLLANQKSVIHPFPSEILKLNQLAPWQEDWTKFGQSCEKKAFLPPLPPLTCFSHRPLNLEFHTHIEWPSKFDPYRSVVNSKFAILILNESENVIATAQWSTWGRYGKVAGTDFDLFQKFDDGFLWLSFDLRPYYEFPSYGPHFRWLDCFKERNRQRQSNREFGGTFEKLTSEIPNIERTKINFIWKEHVKAIRQLEIDGVFY